MKLSIIIVGYRAKKRLFDCIKSIENSKPKNQYEIIVIDNDETSAIKNETEKKFPFVQYFKSKENKGYGAGNNLGAKRAKGQFLFFLNPDTIVFPDTIDILLNTIEKNKNIGIVAPFLLDKSNNQYDLQGARELTPFRAFFVLSFINKYFPKNPVSRDYWILDWDKISLKEVDTVPGTAFIIRREVFEKIKGFDENFFLYFEEFDLCRRIRKLGFKIFMDPKSKVKHFWGESTKERNDIKRIFAESRFYYFRKSYGFFWALLVQFVTSLNKYKMFLSFFK